MRRVVVVILAVLVCGAAAASAAGSRHAKQLIVCPLSASAVTCCGPPIKSAPANAVPCCPGPIEPVCPPSLSISASPDPSTAGQKVTISGTLFHSAGAGTTVQLWQELPGEHTFTKDGTATTDVSGNWSLTVRPMTNRKFYVTADGIQSVTISQPVMAVVTLAGTAFRLHGRVTPRHARERVWVQRAAGTAWLTIARPRLNRKSRFSWRSRGLHSAVRVLLPADRRNARSISRVLVFH